MKRRILAALCLLPLLFAPVGAVAAGGSISIDVRDVDVTDVIALLASESGQNIVTDGSVKPERVSLHLHGVSFDEALRAITGAHGLEVRRDGGILIVGAAENMNRSGATAVLPLLRAQPEDVAKEIAAALPEGTVIFADKRTNAIVVAGDPGAIARARTLASELDVTSASNPESIATQAFALRYLRPDDAVAKLKVVLTEGTFLADEAQNEVLVTGTERVRHAAEGLIGTIDRASPQVMFEVKVADLTPVNDASNVGVEFGGLDLQGNPLSGAATWALTGGTVPIYLRLNALVSQGRASIIATPKLVTINNKEANLSIGETYPIVYSTSVFGGQNVQYVDIGVHLRVTATIGSDGSVTADLHPEYSELIGYTTTGYPIVANRKIDSTLRVMDGNTIVLGGLVRDTSNETREKIPVLGDIPLIGGLFKNKSTNHERDEIVFLITPHVIYPGSIPPQR